MTSLTKLPKPEAIIFDWDNTLVDSVGFMHKSMNKTQEAFNIPLTTYEHTLHNMGAALNKKEFFYNAFLEKAEEAHDFFYQHYKENHDQILPLTGAGELLDTLHKKNIPMGVVSNKRGEFLRKEISNFSWEYFFKTCIGSGDTEEDKPSPIPLLKAIRELTLKPSGNIWYVGDGIVDVECANNANCLPVIIGIAETEVEKFYPKCNHYVANHEEFIKITSLF
jgi:phosphoglycolate phosphatase